MKYTVKAITEFDILVKDENDYNHTISININYQGVDLQVGDIITLDNIPKGSFMHMMAIKKLIINNNFHKHNRNLKECKDTKCKIKKTINYVNSKIPFTH